MRPRPPGWQKTPWPRSSPRAGVRTRRRCGRFRTTTPRGCRRQAVLALLGAGSLITADDRVDLLQDPSDRSFMVRYEAVRAWARRGATARGCQPLLDTLNDDSLHIVLAALDALADSCPGNDLVTERLASETRTPPPQGSWQRQAHAFVALAKRAPNRAEVALPTFATHIQWPVRMYAARAAALMNDVAWLTRLAYDPDDNVAEVALPPLRKRLGTESDAIFVAALGRKVHATASGRPGQPYQAIRTAAIELKGSDATPQLVTALGGRARTNLGGPVRHLSRYPDGVDRAASRDGIVAETRTLTPLLKDADSEIARAAAALIGRWTGAIPEIVPVQRTLQLPSQSDLSSPDIAIVEMASGRSFRLRFDKDQAPSRSHGSSGSRRIVATTAQPSTESSRTSSFRGAARMPTSTAATARSCATSAGC